MYAEESDRLLKVGEISLITIQACVLLGTISNAEGQADSGSIYYAIAVRIAAIMDLANRPAACWVEKEVNIRGMILWDLQILKHQFILNFIP